MADVLTPRWGTYSELTRSSPSVGSFCFTTDTNQAFIQTNEQQKPLKPIVGQAKCYELTMNPESSYSMNYISEQFICPYIDDAIITICPDQSYIQIPATLEKLRYSRNITITTASALENKYQLRITNPIINMSFKIQIYITYAVNA